MYHIDSRHPEHGEKRFACGNCNKAFIYEASTRIHRTQRKCGVNIEKHPHVCELCGSNFGHKSKLNEHMLLKHSNSDDKTKLVSIYTQAQLFFESSISTLPSKFK